MPQMMVSTGRALIPTGSYAEKVRGSGPIAYWPLWEASGTVARCLINPAQNGTYSSDVSTWPVGAGIGDGNTAPISDGTNDYVDVWTATFQAAFSGVAGTAALWARVSGAGVWTDGIYRYPLNFYADANNYVQFFKPDVINTLYGRYRAGGTLESRNWAETTTAWMHLVITWSFAADRVRVYENGVQIGVDMTLLGVWAGGLAAATTCLGASSNAPTFLWSGPIAHGACWTRELQPSEVASLATV